MNVVEHKTPKYTEFQDLYLFGRCILFAIVLSDELGYTINLAYDKWLYAGGNILIHAWCEDVDGNIYDVRGYSPSQKDVLSDYEFDQVQVMIKTSSEITDMLKKGFIIPFNDGEQEQIRTYIYQNIKLFTR